MASINTTVDTADPGHDWSGVSGSSATPTALEPTNDFLVGGSGSGVGRGKPGYDDPTAVAGAAGRSGSGGSGGGGGSYADEINRLLAGWRVPWSQEAVALTKQQIAYASRRLTEIEEARKLGDRTGTLTSDEKRMFQEMEDSAVANLKSQVNSQTQDVWNTALSDLVNRGVLQGTVGEKILTGISSENVRTVAEGSNTIRGTTNANMLNMMEGNKNRALTWDNMLSQESLGLLGYGGDLAKSDLNAQLQKLGFGVNANVSLAGIESNESIAGANRALQLQLQNLQNQSQWNIANLNASTNLATAGMSSNAALRASMYNAAGNLTVFGAGLVAKYGPSIINYMSSYNSTPTNTGLTYYNTDPYNDPGYNYPGEY